MAEELLLIELNIEELNELEELDKLEELEALEELIRLEAEESKVLEPEITSCEELAMPDVALEDCDKELFSLVEEAA